MPHAFDAIVIGAGPAGATAGLLLARAGWSVAIVEKVAFPRGKVCGEFLSAANLPLLQHIGLAEWFRDHAGPEIRRVGLFARGYHMTADMPRAHASADGWGRAIGREHLDAMLLERAVAAGATLWQPWTAVEVRDGLCRIAGGPRGETMELRARVVIAAHGSWEPGALPSQPPRRPSHGSDLFGFKARFLNCRLPADLMPLLAFPGGYGGMVRGDHERVSLSCCIRRDRLEQCRHAYGVSSAGEAVLAHMRASCASLDGMLDGATAEGAWRAAGPIRPGIRSTDRDGIFLAGNAAGEAHPVVAEGIGMAMQSGWLLAGHLARSATIAEARYAYARDWRRAIAPRIRVASLIAHWAMRPATVALTLPVLSAFPWTLTEGARLTGKTQKSLRFV